MFFISIQSDGYDAQGYTKAGDLDEAIRTARNFADEAWLNSDDDDDLGDIFIRVWVGTPFGDAPPIVSTSAEVKHVDTLGLGDPAHEEMLARDHGLPVNERGCVDLTWWH